MAAASSPTPSLAWYWVLETLADLKQADTSLLKTLVSKLPDFFSDAPESVRERLALRYLEEFVGKTNPPVSKEMEISGSIDLSRSSEDVLCAHLRKVVSSSNSDIDNSDINQFILQKRSALPKPTLQMLKESILGGDLPILPCTKEMVTETRQGQDGNLQSSTIERNEGVNRPRFDNGNSTENFQKGPSSLHYLAGEHVSHAGVAEDEPRNLISDEPDKDDTNLTTTTNANGPPVQKESNVNPLLRTSQINGSKKANPNPGERVNFPGEPSSIHETSSGGGSQDDIFEAQNNQLLSSQFNTSFTQENLCIKCDKGGQVLNCAGKSCLIAVHETCLGETLVKFDKEGCFYCPFCYHFIAAREYSKAKKNFLLARKNLSTFLGKNRKEKDKSNFEERDLGQRENQQPLENPVEEDQDNNLSDMGNDDGFILQKRGENNKLVEELEKYRYVKTAATDNVGGSSNPTPRNGEGHSGKRMEERSDTCENLKRHKPSPRYKNPALPVGRRNVLPWTTQEEEILREGVQKFPAGPDGRIPWTYILDFGRNVFHKSRQPGDLKDKWRNVKKREGRAR